MDALKEFVGLDGLTDDDFVSAATDILCTGDIIHGFKNPQGMPLGQEVSNQEASEAVIKNPNLAVGIVLLTRLERLHFDCLEGQKTTQLLLQELCEKIDLASESNQLSDAWLKSDLAASAMAESLGINTISCESFADVRYLIAKKLAENAGGAA